MSVALESTPLDATSRHDVREGGSWTPAQRFKNDLIYLTIRVALAALARLPARALRGIGATLGLLVWCVATPIRRRVRARLVAGLGAPGAGAQVRRTFTRAGALLGDTIALLDPKERAASSLALDEASAKVFADAIAEGRGVVFVSAHLGAWERMAARLVEAGFPVTTVARESYDPRLTALYEELRAPRGVRSIYRGRPGAELAIVRELRAGRPVGFLIDLPGRAPSAPCELFGAPAPIAIGAIRVALARRAAVVVGTPMPGGAGAPPHVEITRIETRDLPARRGRVSEDAALALCERVGRELSRRIAAEPEAWLGAFR